MHNVHLLQLEQEVREILGEWSDIPSEYVQMPAQDDSNCGGDRLAHAVRDSCNCEACLSRSLPHVGNLIGVSVGHAPLSFFPQRLESRDLKRQENSGCTVCREAAPPDTRLVPPVQSYVARASRPISGACAPPISLENVHTLRHACSVPGVIAKQSAVPAGAAAHPGHGESAPSGYRTVTREIPTDTKKKATAT